MKSTTNNSILIIVCLLTPLLCISQKVINQFGGSAKCTINENTVQVNLPTGLNDEGLSFIVNLDGKTCTSGKVIDLEGYKNMKLGLEELKATHSISNQIYDKVL